MIHSIRNMEIALVYLVAGLSSRFGGKIKQFAQVGPNNETLIEYSLNQALPAGFTKIVFIVGEKTITPFSEKFGSEYQGIPIHYALQTFDPEKRDRPWGTCDAVCYALPFLNCPFVVCAGDDLYGSSTFQTLVNHLKESEDEATIGYALENVIPEEGGVNRGIFYAENNFVIEIRETYNIKKNNLKEQNLSKNDLCSMLIFALHQKTLEFLNKNLDNFKIKNQESRTAECMLPNELSQLIPEKKIKMKVYPSQEHWYGVTNPEDEQIIKDKILYFSTGKNTK